MAFFFTFNSLLELIVLNIDFRKENAGLQCCNVADDKIVLNPDLFCKGVGVDGCQQFGMVVATVYSD